MTIKNKLLILGSLLDMGLLMISNSFSLYVKKDSDITIVANFKYDEFTLTLSNAQFADGSTSRSVEYMSQVDDLAAGNPTQSYECEEQVGWIDEEGYLYDIVFVMPSKDLTISPFYGVDGQNHTLSTSTRNYAGGVIVATQSSFNDFTSTSYVIPAGATGDYFDIMNASSSTDGFVINKDESRNLYYMFQNEGDHDISFTYSVEVGSVDITVPSHSYVIQKIGTLGTKTIRPYHHLTLTSDLEDGTTLTIMGFECDKYTISLYNAAFEDGSTSKVLRAGDPIPKISYDSQETTKDYEEWNIVDQYGNVFNYYTMPYSDLEVTAQKVIVGTNLVLAGARYNSSKKDITSAQVTKEGQKATTYTIPQCSNNTKYDIKNSGSMGFSLDAGETKKILFRFYNDEDVAISFNYDTEFGSFDVTVDANSYSDHVIEVTNSTTKSSRPYHHFTVKQSIEKSTDLTIACFDLTTQ